MDLSPSEQLWFDVWPFQHLQFCQQAVSQPNVSSHCCACSELIAYFLRSSSLLTHWSVTALHVHVCIGCLSQCFLYIFYHQIFHFSCRSSQFHFFWCSFQPQFRFYLQSSVHDGEKYAWYFSIIHSIPMHYPREYLNLIALL